MLNSATLRLKDAQIKGLSEDSQFLLAYGAAYYPDTHARQKRRVLPELM